MLRKLRSQAGFGRQDDRWGFSCRLRDDILDAGVLWRCFGSGGYVCCGSFDCTWLRGKMALWGHFHAGGKITRRVGLFSGRENGGYGGALGGGAAAAGVTCARAASILVLA